MKKALLYGLSLALLLSLAACSKPQTDQQEPSQPDPAATSTPADVSTPEQEQPTAPEQLSDKQNEEKQPLSGDALISYFKLAYDSSKVAETDSLEEQIKFELFMLDTLCNNDNKQLPADYKDQYKAWRPVDEQSSNQQQEQAAPEVTLTFTSVNEQVWATGTVNLRSGPSTEDAKVGSLNKGNSVTRIGVGTGDYSSWSKVKLSDGSEVYVASSYLTTTKPTTQSSSKPSGGTTSSTQNQTQNQTQQTSKPSSGGKDIYGGFPTYKEYIDDICKQRPDKTRAEIEAAFPDQAQMSTDEAAARADAAAGRFNH